MTFDEKQQYIELARLRQDYILNRKSIEWKVGFGFWGGIAAVTYFMVEHLAPIHSGAFTLLVIVYIFAFVIWTVCWQMPLHNAFEADREWRDYYLDRAEVIDRLRPERDDKGFRERFQTAWRRSRIQLWFWGQVLMSLLFLILSAIIIFCAPGNAPADPANQAAPVAAPADE